MAFLLNWWPMWREGDTVFFHEQLLLERPAGWQWSNPRAHVHARERRSEDGDLLSEWTLPVDVVAAFLRCS